MRHKRILFTNGGTPGLPKMTRTVTLVQSFSGKLDKLQSMTADYYGTVL